MGGNVILIVIGNEPFPKIDVKKKSEITKKEMQAGLLNLLNGIEYFFVKWERLECHDFY